MLKERARILAITVFSLDLSLVAAGFFIAYWLRSEMLPALAILPGRLYPLEAYIPLLALGLLIWGVLLPTSGLYRSHRTIPLLDEAWKVTRVCLTGSVIFTLAIYALRLDDALLGNDKISRIWVLLFPLAACILLLTEKLALRLTSRYVRTRGYNYRTVLISTNDSALDMVDTIDSHRWWGFKVLGFVANGRWRSTPLPSAPRQVEDLLGILEHRGRRRGSRSAAISTAWRTSSWPFRSRVSGLVSRSISSLTPRRASTSKTSTACPCSPFRPPRTASCN